MGRVLTSTVACPTCPLIRLAWSVSKLKLMDARGYASKEDIDHVITLVETAMRGIYLTIYTPVYKINYKYVIYKQTPEYTLSSRTKDISTECKIEGISMEVKDGRDSQQ